MDTFEQEIKLAFLEEARDLLVSAEKCFLSLETASSDPSVIEQIFRLAHNFKGSAGAVGFDALKEFAHKLESLLLKVKQGELAVSASIIDLLLRCNDFLIRTVDTLRADPAAPHGDPALVAEIEARMRGDGIVAPAPAAPGPDSAPAFEAKAKPAADAKKPAAEENIRVSLEKIDQLLNNVGELSILQTVMDQQRRHAPSPLMQKTIGQMSKIIKEVQTISMSLRMLPLKQTFQKMQRIVRDTSSQLGKEVEFACAGEETELDKTVIEQLGDPLVHMIRNAVDHGLESGDDREAAGKPRAGHVTLSASHRGGRIVIEIRDDGRGLDATKLVAKAKEKGILPPGAALSPEDAYKLIFAPGFSTKETVTDVSGRGVGMDVVNTNIAQLQGVVEIETELGKGTCFRISLPITLAIVDGMVVACGENRYVVPIAQVHETLQPRAQDLGTIMGQGEVLLLRGQSLPLYRLERLMRIPGQPREAKNSIALICSDKSLQPFAVLVDAIQNQQQVVIKSLGEEITGLPGISGAAILGDGRVSLIVDLFEFTAPMRRRQKTLNPQPQGAVA